MSEQADRLREVLMRKGILTPTSNDDLSPEQCVAAPSCKPELPQLFKPTRADVSRIAEMHTLDIAGVFLAARRGLLHASNVAGRRCWLITDSSRWLTQFHAFDGRPFVGSGGAVRPALTWLGSWGAWPIGCLESAFFPSVALAVGAVDLLTAFHFILKEGAGAACAPVAMLRTDVPIAEDALTLFRGKRVRILAHVDPPNERGEIAGIEAAARWEAQLTAVGAKTETFDLSGLTQKDGAPVRYLNDMARVSRADFEAEPELSALMTF